MEKYLDKLLNKLENNDYKSFQIMGSEQLEIIEPNNFEDSQMGFRFDGENEIKDWAEMIGDDVYVIGFISLMGDPILVEVNNENFPVHWMMHDDWEYAELIENSFDNFIENLKALDKFINTEKHTRNEIREYIKSIEKTENNDFYELLCFDILDEDGFLYNEFE